MAKAIRDLSTITVAELVKFIKAGNTVTAAAAYWNTTVVTLYRRFPKIKGISPAGRRWAARPGPKRIAKKGAK